MKHLRLGYVMPDLQVGGLQSMVVQLAGALNPEIFTPVVYTFDGDGPLVAHLKDAEIRHVHVPRLPGVQRGYARELAAHFEQDDLDLVHCHNVTALFHGGRAAWRLTSLPTLFTEHDREMPGLWRHRLLHRWLAQRVTHTVAVSRGLMADLVRYEGFPPEGITAILNGIPDPRSHVVSRGKECRKKMGWGDVPIVLAVGSLTEVKNHHGLIEAFAQVRRSLPEALLAIAGQGPLEGVLKKKAASKGLQESVCFLGERDDVPQLLEAADLFVLPSHREGLPLSLVEAHAMGRPSVATDVGGISEVLIHGETGILVPPGEEEALVHGMESLLRDVSQRRVMGKAARYRYEQKFSHSRMVEEYIDLYQRLIASEAP
ncbi:MAG: glycosyltransferase [Planctomycetota bacterium]|nr:glycosyltransferase [Planctomycetota bacterium]